MEDKKHILCYTREPQDDRIYANRLAYSMHLAYSADGERFEALNHNSGVLFAKATDNEDGTLNAKSLKCPYIFNMADGSFGVTAIRIGADGEEDSESKGKVLFYKSLDLLQYTEVGLIDLRADAYVQDVICDYDVNKKLYIIKWCDTEGNWYENELLDFLLLESASTPISTKAVELPSIITDIEGIVARNQISLPYAVAERLKLRLSTPINVSIDIPKEVTVSSLEELNALRVNALYSDGTSSLKRVDWDVDGIDFNKSGSYEVSGLVHQDHYAFPFAINRADPCIGKWKGKYYFIATNDADGNQTLYIREADAIPELIDAKETLILDAKTYEHVGNLLWAPEFHILRDELYIFHAATPGDFLHEECHVMKLKKGGSPTKKEDWSEPKRVVKKDGSYLCEAGKAISLDMTCFEWNNEYYVSWSERQFVPVDLGAWIYIAKVDPDEPWKLITDPVLLSKPDYGWANNHTFVDEGSFVLIRDEKIFMTFSSAAVDTTYVVGLLTADLDCDLLDSNSWIKSNYPLLTSRSVLGEYGPGHNSYITDEYGDIWNAYHARAGVDAPRSSGLRRVHFDIDGYPVLDLTEKRDLNPELRKVSVKLVVE